MKLKDFAIINMGQSPKGETYNTDGNGMPFLQGRKTFGRIYPTIDTWTTNPIKSANKDDILMSVRAPVGDMNFANQKICIGRGLCSITAKNGRNKYLYYMLLNSMNNLKQKSTGTVFDSINRNDLENLEIDFHSEKDQEMIENILGSIDSKIELNNDISNNLCELINFNYSKYLNELDDYVELDVKEIFDFETGVEPGSKNYLDNFESGTIKFYRVGDMNSDCNTFIKKELSNGKLIEENDVVVSFDATIGRIGYGLSGAYSTGMKKISISDNYKDVIDNSIVYAYFNNRDIKNIMMGNARGTTILHASSSIDFMTFKFNDTLLKKYSKVNSVLFDKMKNIKKENENLLELRNTLLPKLISGEIDFDNIGK